MYIGLLAILNFLISLVYINKIISDPDNMIGLYSGSIALALSAFAVIPSSGPFTGALYIIYISMFNGMITGLTVEAVDNQRLVQVWRADNWPEGSFSLVRFEFDGDDSGTIIRLEHTGFSKDSKEHLEAGWYKMYWEPLKQHTESK